MVLRRPDAILDMTAKGTRTDLTKPLRMIKKGEVLFDLNVTEIVPVTDLRRIEFVEQRWQFAFVRNFLVTAAAFDPKLYFFRCGVLNDPAQTILHSIEMGRRSRFAFFDGTDFFPNVFAGKQFAFSSKFDQRIGHRFHRYFPEMHDDKGRAESLGEIDGLKGLFHRALAFVSVGGRKLVAIGRSAQHFYR